MRVLFKPPYSNSEGVFCGNIVWVPPYIYDKSDLESSIASLEKKGYWISLFPEGDGITFNHETNDAQKIYFDFQIAFPYLSIVNCGIESPFDFEKDLFPYQLVIMPLERLIVTDTIHTSEFSIYPPGTFDFRPLNIKRLDLKPFDDVSKSPKVRDHITLFTGVSLDVFNKLPIVVFSTNKISYEEYIRMPQTEDEFLMKKLSLIAEDITNVVNYYHGDYRHPEFMMSKPGLWNGRYSAALIYFPQYQIAHIQSREVEVKGFIKSIGLELIQNIKVENCFHLMNDMGETGYVAKHALRLNSAILDTDDFTLKFSQIMTLFEFLAEPNEYIQFKKAKTQIAPHIAKTKTEYHDLMKEFEFLTSGVKKAETGEIEGGYRTSIIHIGKRLEDLIPNREEQFELLHKLQKYVSLIIDDMIFSSHLDWGDFVTERQDKRKALGIE